MVVAASNTPEASRITPAGVFTCRCCGTCCRWPGQVRLNSEDIRRLSEFQGVSEFDFIQGFTRLRTDRRGLALLDQPNGQCIFLGDHCCRVHPAKPQQCRDFPMVWRDPGAGESCPGLRLADHQPRALSTHRRQS